MNDLDTLRPEVREAIDEIDDCMRMDIKVVPVGALGVIRAELLRLAGENARLLAANRDAMDHFEQMKAELASLKARIAKPVDRSHKYVQSKEHGGCSECGYPEWEPWHRVALVKVEE